MSVSETDETHEPDDAAEQAEKEAAEEAEHEEHEQTLEPASDAGPSSEATMAKADRENRRYMKALEKILGPDESRHECSACNGLGIAWGEDAPEFELTDAKDTEPCSDCNALGIVRTGSKNPEQATKPCSTCGGRGWNTKMVQQNVTALPMPPAAPTPHSQMGTLLPTGEFVPFGTNIPAPDYSQGA